LGGSIHTVNKKTGTLAIVSMGIGLGVNVVINKYVVMSWDQNAGRNHSTKTDNSSFERVEYFKYLGANLKNQNSVFIKKLRAY
jgi:hypothetical protein